MDHYIKVLSNHFQSFIDGNRTGEPIFKRYYLAGDSALLEEFDPDKGYFTGRWISAKIAQVTMLDEENCILEYDIIQIYD